MKRTYVVLGLIYFAALAQYAYLRWARLHSSTVFKPTVAASSFAHTFRIGFYRSSQTTMLYRLYRNGEFKNLELPVELLAKISEDSPFASMSDMKDNVIMRDLHRDSVLDVGHETADELVQLLSNGGAEAVTMRANDLLIQAGKGLPLVAVAELGTSENAKFQYGLFLRKSIVISGAKSYKGLKFGTRLSDPVDEVVMREFISRLGLSPDKDVQIRADIPDYELPTKLSAGDIDATFLPKVFYKSRLVQSGHVVAAEHADLSWAPPGLNTMYLVTTQEFAKTHQAQLVQVLKAYRDGLKADPLLHPKDANAKTDITVEVESNFEGIAEGEFREDLRPHLNVPDEWQKLLVKYGFLQKPIAVDSVVDNGPLDALSRAK